MFWQIDSAVSISVFPTGLFGSPFPEGCTANKTTSPVPPRPCSVLSPDRQQWDQENTNMTDISDGDPVKTVNNDTLPVHRRRLLANYWSSWRFPGESKLMNEYLPVYGGFWWNFGDRRFVAALGGRGFDSPVPGFGLTGEIQVGWNYPEAGPNADGCISAQIGGSSKVLRSPVSACARFLGRRKCIELLTVTIGEVCVPSISGWNTVKPIELLRVGKSIDLAVIKASLNVILTAYFANRPSIDVKVAISIDLPWPLGDFEKEVKLLELGF